MADKKKPDEDIIATAEEAPETIPDTELDDVEGGFFLRSGMRFKPQSETIYAGVSDDLVKGAIETETIYAGAVDFVKPPFRR